MPLAMFPLDIQEASIAVGKKGKALFKWLIEAAICLVVNSTEQV
jgi:hypothetical protein